MLEPLILVHGEDRHLVTAAAEELRAELTADLISELGLEEFRDPRDLDELERSLASPPFLAVRRVVFIWDPLQTSRAAGAVDGLLAVISRRAETTATCLVVRSSLAPGAPLLKGVRQLGGEIRALVRPRGQQLRRFVDARLAAAGVKAAPAVAQALCDVGSQDMGRLLMELQKLSLFVGEGGGAVDAETGSRLVTPAAPQELYRLTDALFDAPRSLGGRLRVLSQRPDIQPPVVIGALARVLRDLIARADPAFAGGGVQEWKVERMERQLARAGESRLRDWLVRLGDLDWRIRTGEVDGAEGLELLLAEMALELSRR